MVADDSLETDGVWVGVGPVGSLDPVTTFKHDAHQLCLVATEDGVHAIDNRCPHEGYPLAGGEVKGCVLTCPWHNWKFDVTSGACTLGGEGVRSYPVRERDGMIEVDLSDPDPRTLIPPLRESLEEALLEHDNGRAVRDGVRLLLAGRDPGDLLADAVRFDAQHARYGSSHVLAVAADCGRLLAGRAGADAMYAIAPVFDLAGETNRLRPRRDPVTPQPGGQRRDFLHAVESEDAILAEALLRGVVDEPGGFDRAEDWLFDVVSRHFLDFGHQAIYLTKLRELLGRTTAPGAFAADIMSGLLFSIVLGTREDTLPYMKTWFEGVDDGSMERLASRRRESAAFDAPSFRDLMLDGDANAARAALWNALEAGVPAERVGQALVGAAAQRLWRFDLALEFDCTVAENWLWATHRFTFASAVRHAVERWSSPQALRFLFQTAAFTHTGRKMDGADVTLPPGRSGTAPDVVRAIIEKDPERAVGIVRWLIESGAPMGELRESLEALSLDDPAVRPIVVAHVIKTAQAAFDEWDALAGHEDRPWPLYAAIRFIASPVKERRVHHLVETSIAWVADGKMPRKLTQ